MGRLIKPAIVVIGYSRHERLFKLLCSVKEAEYRYDNITLIISIDFWKEDNLCYNIAENFEWKYGEKIIIKQKENLGLRRHVLACGDLSEEYDAVILLEDDIVVSEQFYNYAVAACTYYYDKKEILGIGLYTPHYNGFAQIPFYPIKNGYDSYYGKWVISWGESFCKNQWRDFRNWYEKHKDGQLFYAEDIPYQIKKWPESSWGKYAYFYMFEKDKFFVMPYEAYATNFADSGVHVKYANDARQTVMQRGERKYCFADNKTAVKYDMYFENMDIERFIKVLKISGEICIDLNGERKSFDGYSFCVSTQKLPYKVIRSYDLRVKPIEENIFYNISGDGIFLYDLKQLCDMKKGEKKRQQYKIERYYYPTLQYKRMLNYMFYEAIRKLKDVYAGGVKWFQNKKFYLIEHFIFYGKNKEETIGTIWMFHQVCEMIDVNVGKDYWISTKTFVKFIEAARQKKLKFKTLQELENTDGKSIFLTFDDGFCGVYDNVYPILKRYDIPFTVFVTLDYIDQPGYIKKGQLEELNNDEICTVGAHTITHPKLRKLRKKDAKREIELGKEKLQQMLGNQIDFFAYPYGNIAAVSKRDVNFARKAGYKYAFSTIQVPLKTTMMKDNFFVPRLNVNEENALNLIKLLYY